MKRSTAASVVMSLAMSFAVSTLGTQAAAPPAAGVAHVCSILTKAEVAKFITRGREMYSDPSEMSGICDYGASWAQVLVYSGPNAEQQFDGLLKSFKKDKETRYPLASLGADGWVMYP